MPDLIGSPFTGNVFVRHAPARLRAAVPNGAGRLNPMLSRIIRQQAIGNWLMPSLAVVTPQYIETILRGALGGNHIQQWELFDLMEDTWPRLAKNLGEIKDAVTAMDWKLVAWAEEDTPPTDTALERKQLISSAMWQMRPEPDRDDNDFERTLADILDAGGKGVSVLEILWENRRVGGLGDFALPQATTWVHPNAYAWSDQGFLGLNPSREVNTGVYRQRASEVEPFPEHKFLIAISKAKTGHPLTAARLRPLAWWWCAANFSADWLMNLAQLFGLPFRWATYADDASDDTIGKINVMLADMGSAGHGAFPEGTNLNFLDGGKTAGASPQDGLLDRADKACDILLLRQTLTTDSPTEGGTQALGTVHLSVRNQVIQSWANFAARVINTQFIPAVLIENYGDAEEAPWFEPTFVTKKDLAASATRIQSGINMGLRVSRKWAHEELEIPLPQPGEEVLSRATSAPTDLPGAPNSDSVQLGEPQRRRGAEEKIEDADDTMSLSASRRLSGEWTPEEKFTVAVAEKTDPVLGLLNRIAEIKDDQAMLAALNQLYRELDALTALVTADVTRQQRALETITAGALREGLEGRSNGTQLSAAAPNEGERWITTESGRRVLIDDSPFDAERANNWQPGEKELNRRLNHSRAAMDRVIRRQRDEWAALTRPGLGPVDFRWGKPGLPPNFGDGSGVSKIIAKRDYEAKTDQEFAGQTGTHVARAMVETLLRGEVGQPYERGRKVNVQWKNFEAVLAREHSQGGGHWLLTGFIRRGKEDAR